MLKPSLPKICKGEKIKKNNEYFFYHFYDCNDNSMMFLLTGSGLRISMGYNSFGSARIWDNPFSQVTSTEAIDDNEWHHLVYVKNGDVLDLYQDNGAVEKIKE